MNNFFVKFAYFYIENFRSIKDNAIYFWDTIADLMPEILGAILDLLGVIVRTIWIFLPVSTVYNIIVSTYLTPEEIKKFLGRRAAYGRYVYKKEIKEIEAENADN
jgi:hypothetical protein